MKTPEFYAMNNTTEKLERMLATAKRMIEAYGSDRLVYRVRMLTAAIELRQTKGWK